MLPIVLDPHSTVPMYTQIVEQVEGLIKKGVLAPGDRLPPERDLAHQLVVARGTVKKAYEELVRRQLVESTQGRGTFVSRTRPDAAGDRRQRALGAIGRALDVCEDLGFTPNEILPWFQLLMRQRAEARAQVNALALDCNPEALQAFSANLQEQLGISIHGKLLSELFAGVQPVQACEPYDLIVAPSTHFDEVSGVLSPLREKLVQVALAPTYAVIARVGGLSDDVSLALACESDRFYEIVWQWLQRLAGRSIPPLRVRMDQLHAYDFSRAQVLLLPPGRRVLAEQLASRAMAASAQVFCFDYQVEQGSIIHMQSLVKNIVHQRLKL